MGMPVAPQPLESFEEGDGIDALVSSIQAAHPDDVSQMLQQVVYAVRIRAVADCINITRRCPDVPAALNLQLSLMACAEADLRSLNNLEPS